MQKPNLRAFKPRLRFRRIMLVLLGLLLAWGVLNGQQVLEYAALNVEAQGDVAIVLGAAVYRETPSPVFRERINHAIDLYKQGQVQAIIFTGGIGMGDQLAESEAARNYAVAAGIPTRDIYVETVSKNTFQNLAQAVQILVDQEFAQVVIVSDPLHMRRAMEYADVLGLQAVSSPTPTSRYQSWASQSSFLLREVYFLSIYRLFPNQF